MTEISDNLNNGALAHTRRAEDDHLGIADVVPVVLVLPGGHDDMFLLQLTTTDSPDCGDIPGPAAASNTSRPHGISPRYCNQILTAGKSFILSIFIFKTFPIKRKITIYNEYKECKVRKRWKGEMEGRDANIIWN